jgi:mannose-1-phosphate guanylyltransferase
MSREACPKQFLPLFDDATPFQATFARLPDDVQPITIVTHIDHRYIVCDRHVSGREIRSIYLEPIPRHGVRARARRLRAHEGRSRGAAPCPALDHDILTAPNSARRSRAERAAALENLVVFGVEPRWPETGYGYIERGGPAGADGVNAVASFVEKPEVEIATSPSLRDDTIGIAASSSSGEDLSRGARALPAWSSPRPHAPPTRRRPRRSAAA